MSVVTKHKFKVEGSRVIIEVRFDSDWEEWKLEFITNGKKDSARTYFADSEEDALNTAKHLSQGV